MVDKHVYVQPQEQNQEQNPQQPQSPQPSPEPQNNPQPEMPKDRLSAKDKIILIILGLLVLTFVINSTWFVANYTEKESGDVNVNPQVDVPTGNVTNNFENNHQIDVNVSVSDEMVKILSDQILERVNETLTENNTNST